MKSTLENKIFYSYNDAYGNGIKQEHLNSYASSLIFDYQNRAIYAKGHTFGNHYRGSYHGEVFNNFDYNTANGDYSQASGFHTTANGDNSNANGNNTITTYSEEFAIGRYNISYKDALFSVGNGTANNRSNAFSVDSIGNAYLANELYINDKKINSYLDSSYSYIINSYNNLYNYTLSSVNHLNNSYNNLKSYILDSYSFVRDSYNNLYSYTISAYTYMTDNSNNSWNYIKTTYNNVSTAYNILNKSVSDNFTTHEQLKNSGENVDAGYITELGKNVPLHILLMALLDKPEYNRPITEFKLTDGETEYGSVVYKNENPSGNIVEVGTTIDAFISLNFSYFNKNHNTEGISYGFSKCTFNNSTQSFTLTSTGISDLSYQICFDKEGVNNIFTNINIGYLHASYQGYPQLLDYNYYIPSKEKWFNNGSILIPKYNVIAQYKYFYGWDNKLDGINILNGVENWLPIVSSGTTIESPNIAFNTAHQTFWFAYPSEVTELTTTNDFNILYHTAIADADLISQSATEIYKSISVSQQRLLINTETGECILLEDESKLVTEGDTNTSTKIYNIVFVDFNKSISGGTENYLKFTLLKK